MKPYVFHREDGRAATHVSPPYAINQDNIRYLIHHYIYVDGIVNVYTDLGTLKIPVEEFETEHSNYEYPDIEEVIAKRNAQHSVPVISWREMHEDEDLPDRDYRNAYVDVEGNLYPDMTKAKEIHKDKLREERASLLVEEDVKFMKALEDGADTKVIAQRKQALRDVTADPGIEAATTLDELRQVWPEVLGQRKTNGKQV